MPLFIATTKTYKLLKSHKKLSKFNVFTCLTDNMTMNKVFFISFLIAVSFMGLSHAVDRCLEARNELKSILSNENNHLDLNYPLCGKGKNKKQTVAHGICCDSKESCSVDQLKLKYESKLAEFILVDNIEVAKSEILEKIKLIEAQDVGFEKDQQIPGIKNPLSEVNRYIDDYVKHTKNLIEVKKQLKDFDLNNVNSSENVSSLDGSDKEIQNLIRTIFRNISSKAPRKEESFAKRKRELKDVKAMATKKRLLLSLLDSSLINESSLDYAQLIKSLKDNDEEKTNLISNLQVQLKSVRNNHEKELDESSKFAEVEKDLIRKIKSLSENRNKPLSNLELLNKRQTASKDELQASIESSLSVYKDKMESLGESSFPTSRFKCLEQDIKQMVSCFQGILKPKDLELSRLNLKEDLEIARSQIKKLESTQPYLNQKQSIYEQFAAIQNYCPKSDISVQEFSNNCAIGDKLEVAPKSFIHSIAGITDKIIFNDSKSKDAGKGNINHQTIKQHIAFHDAEIADEKAKDNPDRKRIMDLEKKKSKMIQEYNSREASTKLNAFVYNEDLRRMEPSPKSPWANQNEAYLKNINQQYNSGTFLGSMLAGGAQAYAAGVGPLMHGNRSLIYYQGLYNWNESYKNGSYDMYNALQPVNYDNDYLYYPGLVADSNGAYYNAQNSMIYANNYMTPMPVMNFEAPLGTQGDFSMGGHYIFDIDV